MIHCSENHLAYREFHADAERREKAGEKQVYCLKCRLWVWPDQVAFEHREHTRTSKQFDQIVKQAKERHE